MQTKRTSLILVCLLLATIATFLLNIAVGQVAIPVKEVVKSILGSKIDKETWEYIIINYRIPKAITAVLVGIGLSVCGLLMQTMFQNPLAGPYVLGLSSGSSLVAALVIMGSGLLPAFLQPFLSASYSIVLASCLGSFLVLLIILFISNFLRDTSTILIVGLMWSSFAGAIISVLTYFSSAEALQKFTFWSLGNIGNLNYTSISLLFLCTVIGTILSLFSLKSLDALLLGEKYAKSLGVNIKKTRYLIIIASSILAGSSTAFVGPIAFIGLAVPHIAKLIFRTSNHLVLFISTLFLGAILMLLCDSISQMPGMEFTLPINAITSIVGAPVVIWLLLKQNKS
jgi:iron complex transport system permease protein